MLFFHLFYRTTPDYRFLILRIFCCVYFVGRVHLAPAPGKTLVYTHAEWTAASRDDAASLALTLGRAARQAEIVGGVPDIVEPAIPALEIVRTDGADSSAAGAGGDVSGWPKLLQTPLIKVKAEAAIADEPKAVASGVGWYLYMLSCFLKKKKNINLSFGTAAREEEETILAPGRARLQTAVWLA